MEYYKQTKQREEELAILDDYILNSEDFNMDCEPLTGKELEEAIERENKKLKGE